MEKHPNKLLLLNKETNLFKIEEAAYRKDAKAGCMDIKFSPCSSMKLP